MTDAPQPPTPQSDDQIQNLLTWLRGEGETEWVAAVEALAAGVAQLEHEIEQQVKHRAGLKAEVERAEAALSERIASHEVCVGMVRELRGKWEAAEAEVAELLELCKRAMNCAMSVRNLLHTKPGLAKVDREMSLIDAALAAKAKP